MKKFNQTTAAVFLGISKQALSKRLKKDDSFGDGSDLLLWCHSYLNQKNRELRKAIVRNNKIKANLRDFEKS